MSRLVLARSATYALAVAASLVAIVSRAAIEHLLGPDAPLLIFVVAVVFSSALGGLGPGLVATAAGALAMTLSFEPVGHISVAGAHDLERVAVFVVMGIATSALTHHRRQLESRANEASATALASLERERQLRSQAEHLARVRDEFLATVSHELRTPLAAVLGWTQVLLSSDDRSAPEQRKILETIERNARAQKQIIDDLLDASTLVTGKLQIQTTGTRLDEIARAAVETVRPATSARGIHVETDLTEVVVEADPERLHQIAWNLLSNSAKFGRSAGTISVRVRRQGDEGVLEVRDDGRGIEPSFLPYVFDKFRQEDPSPSRRFGGLGLGLAITRSLVDLHGGRITAESPGPGGGATFTVRLPIARGDRTSAVSESRPGRALEGTAVLVVDDDPDALEVAATTLEHAGAHVLRARSAEEALAAVQSGQVGVVLMDLMMPGTDGFATLEAIRAKGMHAPVIALTALAFPTDQQRTRRAGFAEHLVKPVEADALVRTVAAAAHVRAPAR